MQKIIDNFGITVSAVCAIHCVLLPAIFIIAPYSFLASHEFHVALIYFILPCGAVAFILGCKKHGDLKVAILGSLGLACLITAMIIHELAPKHQHSEEFITIIVTILGSTLLIISHLRNRKLCATEHYTCHK